MSDFSSLYQKYAGDVYRYALYLSGQHAEADDITAETFARVWIASEPIVMATVKGYLFTIARNLYLHGLRRSARHDALDEALHDPRPGPDTHAEHSERLQSVLKQLQALPETSRSALLMHAVDGMAYQEIAQVLGVSLSVVKVRIHRARFTLAGGVSAIQGAHT
jgi:RNA polymerase sigma factor (sigma-70 family)